ncbi:MAG: hypothetical protein ACYSR6_09775 [Planctomycetota bacterium]|jgi:hypothetical protein
MSGFSLDTQRFATMHGLKFECGHVTFAADSATLEVPTGLNTVFAGGASLKKSTSDAITHGSVGVFDNEVSTAGAVTLTRITPYLADAPTYNYWLMGW